MYGSEKVNNHIFFGLCTRHLENNGHLEFGHFDHLTTYIFM